MRVSGMSVSGIFPTLRNRYTSKKKGNKKMAKENSFKIVVKDGDEKWELSDSGEYKSKTVDYVYNSGSNFVDALVEFLSYVQDTYNNSDKVSLVFTPADYQKAKKAKDKK
jgi:hypothetical protein